MTIARLGFAAGALLPALAFAQTATVECPPGTVKVGERRVEYPDRIVVHPQCRRTRLIEPAQRGMPFQVAVAEVTGDVVIHASNGLQVEKSEVRRHPLVDGTRLTTGTGAGARLELVDGTTVSLAPNTAVEVQRVTAGEAPLGLELVLDVKRGFVRWRDETVKRAKRRFGVRVVRTSVAVRGTDFEASATGPGSGYIRVREGTVDYLDASQGAAGEIRAGQTLSIVNGTIVKPQ